MRILVKWYFNELLGYLIMSFTSIPVIANYKNTPECSFYFSIERVFNVETAIKRKKNDSTFNSYNFIETVCWYNIYNRP